MPTSGYPCSQHWLPGKPVKGPKGLITWPTTRKVAGNTFSRRK